VTDDPFGPVIVFGAGGTMIELLNDRAMELPPLNQFLARRLIERSRVAETLGAWRGAVAVDARIVIDNAPQAVSGRSNNYHHLAILPYPARHEEVWPLRGGGQYIVRPIHPNDAQMLQGLVQHLSPESRYTRFVSSMPELPPSMLARFTLIDYDREMALVAVVKEKSVGADGSVTETERIVGVSRYITNLDQSSCEFSLLVADDFSGKGLGSRLMESIMDVAREKGLSEIEGLVLAKNPSMLKLMKSLGFSVRPFAEDPDFMLVTHTL
jgi:acetyltransferase